ncbi:mannan endo-1,6-alpha-mannosidase [Hortaea werneckii]|uniref:Mannan endo-1,6-alpha-mannosidase n=1 Tax=Hortaea werneckii TaxID=91943 RepID=A0A3M7EH01_HORWE|nr:mannan endo-1,6-alpha-mannosidase [Hortaea werneckii]KAI6867416.1 mannan endo-1,6-alpha-mannosidase [Hortaea werneckii]KAI7567587.1 mannan endo-1,6-alpha-mannosidase [Hortaea werneckii]KAI7613334.1 mannan endo-1,6-alpha-mannosidase [Hortaea werneckii]KAI7621722.1 mannan endo-1,6-alpha-mannosidase [Hortaea werneckii]
MNLIHHLAVIATVIYQVSAIALDVGDQNSVKQAVTTLAQTFYEYHNPSATTGQFDQPEPWFWWLSGAGWTALIDYTAYTNDTTYISGIHAALSANAGADNDLAPASQAGWEANDDQAYWAYATLSALEYGFPPLTSEPADEVANVSCANSWFAISDNVFQQFVTRWYNNSITCNGGLKWQYNPEETGNGWTYKNSVTNGGFFQLAARLARYTDNSTYAEWANTIWDWSSGVGLIGPNFHVFDGTSDADGANCSSINRDQWSYNIASYMHGAANMFAYSGSGNGSSSGTLWEGRVHNMITAANQTFFSPYPNATGVMYEQICEPRELCNTDQASFKGSLARWMSKSAALVPSAKEGVMELLRSSAEGAAQSCSGLGNSTCGTKWYVGGYDGVTGFGQQVSGLEVMLSLMINDASKLATLNSNSTVSH